MKILFSLSCFHFILHSLFLFLSLLLPYYHLSVHFHHAVTFLPLILVSSSTFTFPPTSSIQLTFSLSYSLTTPFILFYFSSQFLCAITPSPLIFPLSFFDCFAVAISRLCGVSFFSPSQENISYEINSQTILDNLSLRCDSIFVYLLPCKRKNMSDTIFFDTGNKRGT